MHRNIIKLLLLIGILNIQIFASDAITVDSLFKKKDDFRLITSIDTINSDGTRRFSSYPNLLSYDDGTIITESKKVFFGQTLLYSYSSSLDLFLSYNLSYENLDLIESNKIKNETDFDFDSLWIGGSYNFDKKIAGFRQSLSFQTSLTQKTKYQNEEENYSLKSYNIKYSLKSFSDPLISTFYLGTTQNLDRNINDIELELPNSYSVGLDLFLILNPDVSLNLNFEQNYQTEMKEDGMKVNSSTILSTMGFGITYNINEANAITINAGIGTSTNAPDSRLSLSLWHKF